MVRNSIAAAFSLPLLPSLLTYHEWGEPGLWLIVVIAKEALIGLMIGFISAIPFQAMESAGVIIDNQRGASMAMAWNPLSSEQTLPLGSLLNQAGCALFFSLGYLTVWLGVVYQSYVLWPITAVFPIFPRDAPLQLYLLFSELLQIAWRLAAPAIITMFLAEFGLGLMNRFVPQMNVFILSMPIKSALAILVLILSLTLNFQVFVEQMTQFLRFTPLLQNILIPQNE